MYKYFHLSQNLCVRKSCAMKLGRVRMKWTDRQISVDRSVRNMCDMDMETEREREKTRKGSICCDRIFIEAPKCSF